MKRLVVLVALLFVSFGVSAQIVTSTSRIKTQTIPNRDGLSYGVGVAGSFAFDQPDEWMTYSNTMGVWGDVGYYFSPHFYAGGSLGIQYRDLNDASEGSILHKPIVLRLLGNVRYLFSSEANTLFVDYRAGVNVANPFEDYGRAELGVGYLWNNTWEITAGLENELWNALDGFSEIVKSKGFYIRLGYRFR